MKSTIANWKVLPKHFFRCTNLDTYFSAYKPINVIVTSNIYSGIHGFYMKYFKQ